MNVNYFTLMENEWNYWVLFFITIELRNDIELCWGSSEFDEKELLEVFLQVFEELFFSNIDGTLPKFFQNLCKNKNG